MNTQAIDRLIQCALLLVPALLPLPVTGAETAQPVSVIFDTDMDTDCDDAGALAMLHALAARGEVRILATVVSSKYPYSAPCVEAINRYHGRADLPIGVPKGDGASISRGSRYAKAIAGESRTILKTGDDAPNAAEVYRKVLSAQPDRSVVVVTVGYVTNLRDLLRTKGDDISPLSGPELVRAKVKFLSCMGGRYPELLDPRVNGNFKPDPGAAVEVARDWPRPIYFSGDGYRIQTGRRLRNETPADNPARRVYDLYLRKRPTRPSWDQVALLYAVRPAAPCWTVRVDGYNHIFPNGTNQWRGEPDDPRHRLVAIRPESREQVEEIIDKLMAHVPARAGVSVAQGGDDGFVSLFNGRDLTGWKGDTTIWSVKDGALVGETTPERRVQENNYLIWDGEVEDFELRLRYRIEGGNSGIYCRAMMRPQGRDTRDPVIAWQADIDADGKWTGVIMEWTGRDKLAERGTHVEIDEKGNKKVVGSLGDPDELWARVKKGDWNDYVVVARGGLITLKINGVPMAELEDRDPRRMKRGLLALQVHAGPPMRVAFKDIRLKKFGRASKETVPLKARPFDLKEVRLLDGPFRDARERTRRYLHALESDRLLHTFRVNAGLPSTAEPLGGWERPGCEVRGHTMGHYLTACALMVASTGDEKLQAKAEAIVVELARCQEALGESGYLSAFPESFIDRAEAAQRVWAPYYTLHKIFAGLLDMHVHCGSEKALEVLQGMLRWVQGRNGRLDGEQMQRMLDHTEQGGMNDVLANAHALTGDPELLSLSLKFNQKSYNEPLVERQDRLKGLHVNSMVPNITGTARQYELTGNDRYRGIAEYFWSQVVGARSYCTGGTSHHEHWRTDPHVLARELGPTTQETCCTYNLLKLTRHLFTWTADPRYADYYERALWTSILGTQDPETGMMMYFVPLAAGYWKVFNTPRDSFWCCTGTGIESFSKTGDSIYFHDDQGLYVNLFIASELDWSAKGVQVRQETRFPEEEGTTLTVRAQRPVELTLRIRVPWWARRGFELKLDGEKVDTRDVSPGQYFSLRRLWRGGERVEVSFPMSLYAEPMPDDKTVVAYLCGPLVLAGRLGDAGLTPELTYCGNQGNHGPPVDAPYLLTESPDPESYIKPVTGEPLTWRTEEVGQPNDVTLVPFYRLFGERYAVYWNVYRRGSPEHREMLAREAARKARLARVIDECRIGDPASEREHGLKHERSQSGPFGGRAWRHAPDGWFSYDLKVPPDKPVVLACTYWGDDTGRRVFDVLVEGEKIATQKLDRNRPGEFFEVEYELPQKLTRGKGKVTVRFQAHPGNTAGGVFGCAVLRADASGSSPGR